MNIAQKQSIPDYVLQSMFLRQGGFRVFSGLLSSEWQAAMFEEASELMPYAEDNVTMGHDSEEIRGGTPPRSFLSVTAGSVLNAFYQSPEVKTFLEQVTGIPVYLSGMQGTYSFYARPGDYLGLHRDIVTCVLFVNNLNLIRTKCYIGK